MIETYITRYQQLQPFPQGCSCCRSIACFRYDLSDRPLCWWSDCNCKNSSLVIIITVVVWVHCCGCKGTSDTTCMSKDAYGISKDAYG